MGIKILFGERVEDLERLARYEIEIEKLKRERSDLRIIIRNLENDVRRMEIRKELKKKIPIDKLMKIFKPSGFESLNDRCELIYKMVITDFNSDTLRVFEEMKRKNKIPSNVKIQFEKKH